MCCSQSLVIAIPWAAAIIINVTISGGSAGSIVSGEQTSHVTLTEQFQDLVISLIISEVKAIHHEN